MSDNNINKTDYGYDITWIETEFYTSKIRVFEKVRHLLGSIKTLLSLGL